MTERDEAGLRRLKQDLDEVDWPAPELLARYATEPNLLSEVEKRTVERAVASSRFLEDELATLRGFDFSRLDADRRGAGAAARAAGGDATIVGRWLDRLRQGGLTRPPVWAAAAALLALAWWLTQAGPTSGPTTTPESPPQLAERDLPPPFAPSLPTPAVAPEVDERGARRAPSAPDASRVATSELAPIRDRRESEDADAPGVAPAPESEAEILLAMTLPDYRPAFGLEPQAGTDWIVRGGATDRIEVVVLAPDHVTRACSASPVLHWSIDRLPAQGGVFLTIFDADGEPVVLDRPIEPPTRAGLQRLDLATRAIVLPEGRTLRWSIALREEEDGAPTAFDFGWLRFEAPGAAATADLASRGDAGRAAAYAELGCYSEALDAALTVRARHPDDPMPHRAVARLAEQAGFDARLTGE